jgi:hypothetical protein
MGVNGCYWTQRNARNIEELKRIGDAPFLII